MERFDQLVLSHIASFLDPKDIISLRRTCRRMYMMLPEVILTSDKWKRNAFEIFGPYSPAWSPKLFFDGPILQGKVLQLKMSVVWVDQGWGNRKGEMIVFLMRPSRTGEPLQIAEQRGLFGIAEHYETEAHKVVGRDYPLVAKSKKGDFYRFMGNAGGGGGHRLKVKNLCVETTTYELKY